MGCAALALLLAGPAAAETSGAAMFGAEHVKAELVAATDGLAAGRTTLVALRLRHAPHWHTYWQMPGESGLPTTLDWTLPAGYRAGPIQWPLPVRVPTGPLVNYGYDGEVLLPVALDVPATAIVGTQVQIGARARWLECNDVCIPGDAMLQLALPVRAPDALRPSPWAEPIAMARGQVPQPLALAGASATLSGGRIRLVFDRQGAAPTQLDFFPLEPGRIDDAAPQRLQVQPGTGSVALDLTAAQPVAADFHALRGVLVAGGAAPWAGVIDVPLVPGGAGAATAAAAGPGSAGSTDAAPSADASASRPGSVRAGGDTGRAAAHWSLWLALAGALGGGILLNLMPCVFPVLSLKLLSVLQHRRAGAAPPLHHGLAFAAGTVLSCVLLAGLLLALRSAGLQVGWGFQLQAPWVIALLTTLFFLIGLNLLGAYEFSFGTALANSGPVRRFQGEGVDGNEGIDGIDRMASDNAGGNGLRSSFAGGVLVVVVASPCTAPFMGAALGYAATQPAAIALAVFASLGLGMALPYLALTAFPAWQARLPRPGPWMERLRQALAFPMFATCVWLLWVLGQQVDGDALALVLGALVAVGAAAWALGLAQRGAGAWRWVGAAAALLAAGGLYAATGSAADDGSGRSQARQALLGTAPRAQPQSAKSTASILAGAERGTAPAGAARGGAAAWQPWSDAAVQASLAAGHPVFVDFTAAWCVTCQANKRLVLYSDRVTAAFGAAGVTLLRADWTRRDDRITRELARFERNGVPMYLLYRHPGAPELLPEVLTQDTVLAALSSP